MEGCLFCTHMSAQGTGRSQKGCILAHRMQLSVTGKLRSQNLFLKILPKIPPRSFTLICTTVVGVFHPTLFHSTNSGLVAPQGNPAGARLINCRLAHQTKECKIAIVSYRLFPFFFSNQSFGTVCYWTVQKINGDSIQRNSGPCLRCIGSKNTPASCMETWRRYRE